MHTLSLHDALPIFTDRGEVICFELKSGDLLWRQKLPRASASYYSSPVMAGDRMILAREDGVVMVMRILEGGFELLSENDMGERVIASPVPLDGALYLRGSKHLYCIAE